MKIPPLKCNGMEVSRNDKNCDFYDLFESDFGTSPLVLKTLQDLVSTTDLSRYPSDDNEALRKALGTSLGLTSDCFMLGNGDEVLSTIPTWDGFNAFCRSQGLKNFHLPFYEDGEKITMNFSHLEKNLSAKTKLIYLVSPSLPGGIGIDTDDFLKFMSKVPASVTIVIDEAYLGFSERESLLQSHKILNQVKNPVYGLRTFSKFMGLANLRIGYVVARSDVMNTFITSEPPFVLSTLAESAAIAALQDKSFQEKVRALVRDEKIWLKEQIKKMNMRVIDTDFNYLLIDCGNKKNPLTYFDNVGIFFPRNLFFDRYLQFPVSTREKNVKNLRFLSTLP